MRLFKDRPRSARKKPRQAFSICLAATTRTLADPSRIVTSYDTSDAGMGRCLKHSETVLQIPLSISHLIVSSHTSPWMGNALGSRFVDHSFDDQE
ncbi:uncharacterized protein BJ171DRAFT_460966 [Polychytrium aggregatum]|uniref:uncharacterized protein n=1 Tax=Polychytrium aggregatum TaxID=110093 RepID=UPI0022FE86D6|nr:uncharacterized protein BJ171DRAFT_460966 [Polychytrium aggregatum]KAI9202870.1 hypothetical protein BJ171DRAFT_460966 [Polychytrium aggregatum]